MPDRAPIVLILGSGPDVTVARAWPKAWFDQIVVINNAWRVRPDWDTLVFPEDFPPANMPPVRGGGQRYVQADGFVPAQNRYGGFVFAGATMAFTAAYWALDALRPRVMAFMGCDMVYPDAGNTHFYGSGAADPLRDDVSLRDLGAKSARLAVLAAAQGCACVNLSDGASELLFPRARADGSGEALARTDVDMGACHALRSQEEALGYVTPDGRYDVAGEGYDLAALDDLDAGWRGLWARTEG